MDLQGGVYYDSVETGIQNATIEAQGGADTVIGNWLPVTTRIIPMAIAVGMNNPGPGDKFQIQLSFGDHTFGEVASMQLHDAGTQTTVAFGLNFYYFATQSGAGAIYLKNAPTGGSIFLDTIRAALTFPNLRVKIINFDPADSMVGVDAMVQVSGNIRHA